MAATSSLSSSGTVHFVQTYCMIASSTWYAGQGIFRYAAAKYVLLCNISKLTLHQAFIVGVSCLAFLCVLLPRAAQTRPQCRLEPLGNLHFSQQQTRQQLAKFHRDELSNSGRYFRVEKVPTRKSVTGSRDSSSRVMKTFPHWELATTSCIPAEGVSLCRHPLQTSPNSSPPGEVLHR